MILKEKRERYEGIYDYNGLGILNEVKVHEKMKEKKNKKKRKKKEILKIATMTTSCSYSSYKCDEREKEILRKYYYVYCSYICMRQKYKIILIYFSFKLNV